MIENNVQVSIIVPVYGTENYLPACIESICRQSYHNIQIILVDDGSPDRCPEICDNYAQQDFRITVFHQKNKGVSSARNTGMSYVTGKYIMFVDSDDELYPDAVKILVNDAEYYSADIVSATKRIMGKNGSLKNDSNNGECSIFHDHEPLLLSLEGDRNTNSSCAKLFKTDFIKDIRFEEGKNVNEDGFFIFQCYMKKPLLVQHNVAVYQYNFREDSNSRQVYSDKYLSILYFCECKKALLSKYYPQYVKQSYNMEVRTHLQFLQILCSVSGKQYKSLQKASVETVRKLYLYHKPINKYHKKLAWIVRYGFYPIYKGLVRLKNYR